MMKPFFLSAVLMALAALTTGARALDSNTAGQSPASNQSARSKTDERRASSITGRVVNEAGQPLVNVTIRAALIGKRETLRTASTDEEGKFGIEKLTRGVYFVTAYAPGYTNLNGAPEMRFYRVGDTVSFAMTKGGAITGTVTNSSGEPLVAVRVSAIRVRDQEGRAVRASGPSPENSTDDRGVFRIYGLLPGAYVVSAGGNGFFFYQPTAYDGDVPTYHPSSTRDTATPVTLQQGAELSGVDIRYRGERGHAVSGNVTGPLTANAYASLGMMLVSNNQVMGQQHINRSGSDAVPAFAFYGVPDGEYYVIARRFGRDQQELGGMGRVRVKVKGADVTGLEVSTTPYASIAGRIALERLSEAGQKNKCESRQAISFDELLITVNRDQKTNNKDEPYSLFNSFNLAVPTDKGEFTISNIEAGRYHIEARSISEAWYIRAVTQPAAAQDKPPVDAGRNGLALKSGERLAGVTVTIAEGAADLRGRVAPAAEGARLPDRLQVHLVPAEKEAAEDTLRFAEAEAQSDGQFALNNLPPGRYWLLIKPAADNASTESQARPAAWDGEGRAKLLKEGEAASTAIELQPCQRIKDYLLRYTPGAKLKSAGSKKP